MPLIEQLKTASAMSAIGFGGSGIGNLYHAISDEQAVATVHEALARGIRLIDTAPYYGHALSETRIGTALRSWNGERPLISTKVGRVLDPVAPGESIGDFGFADPMPFRPRFDYSRDGIRRSLEGSLQRLGVDFIDIALVHDFDKRTHGEAYPSVFAQFLNESLPALEAARSEGLLRYIGIGVNEWDVCFEALKHAQLDCILLAGRYTLLEQSAHTSGMLEYCAQRGVRVIIAGVFNSGLLATRPTQASTYNYTPVSQDVLGRAQRLWQVCEALGVAPQAAAIQFPLAHPAVSAILVGLQSPAQVADLGVWSSAVLPVQLWRTLRQEGFLPAGVPAGP